MRYLPRKIDTYLPEWKDSVSRKPLLLRGARQVGKSSAVRELGKCFDNIFEINGKFWQFSKYQDLSVVCGGTVNLDNTGHPIPFKWAAKINS